MLMPSLTAAQRPIKLPEDTKEDALRWVQSQAATAHKTPQDAPFRRIIDFWFASITWSVQKGIAPVDKATGAKFVNIGPTTQDVKFQSWKLDLLVLLAIREFGTDDPRAQDPSEVIDVANRYAESGAKALIIELESAREFAVPMLYRVTDIFSDQFKKACTEASQLY